MGTNPPVPPGATKRAEPQSFRARSLSASLTVNDLHKSVGLVPRCGGLHCRPGVRA